MEVPSLECRQMVYRKCEDMVEESREDKSEMSLLQYNLLADASIPRDEDQVNICGSYEYCPAPYRYMDSRHSRIMSEVAKLSPDVVTFQEIEAKHFNDHLKPNMTKLGYDSAQHLRETDHIGLAIFYKKDRYGLQGELSFLLHNKLGNFLQRLDIDENIASEIVEYTKEVSTYSSIIQPPGCVMVKLKNRHSNKLVAVATVHITWKDFKYPVLQMLQAACVTEELNLFAAGSACLLAGDFNVTPDMPLYQMISSGCVGELTIKSLYADSSYIDTNTCFRGKNIVELLKGAELRLQMNSAYKDLIGKELPFSCNGVFEADSDKLQNFCLDYIWYTRKSLCPMAVLDVPEEQEITKNIGLPSTIFPSDHLLLFAKFIFCADDTSS